MADLRVALIQVAENNHLINPKIVYADVTDKGFMGDVKIVQLVGANKTVNLFIKVKRADGNAAMISYYNQLFEAESLFYDKCISEFDALKSLTGFRFEGIPRSYYISKDTIVLENLIAGGFKIWPNLKETLDEDHISLVMRNYGAFHALSYALKQRKPDKFLKLGNYEGVKSEPMLKCSQILKPFRVFETVAERVSAAFDVNNPAEAEYHKAVLDFFANLEDFLQKLVDDSEHDVLVHGDCWPHNFMFKYDANNKPCDIRLLDFQIFRQASPIADLAYFMCTSGCGKAHFDNMQQYLKIYHDSLIHNCKQLNVSDVMSFEQLQAMWRKFGIYGVVWSSLVNKMLIADKDELAANHSDISVLLGFLFVSRHENLYHRRMRDCFKYFYDGAK